MVFVAHDSYYRYNMRSLLESWNFCIYHTGNSKIGIWYLVYNWRARRMTVLICTRSLELKVPSTGFINLDRTPRLRGWWRRENRRQREENRGEDRILVLLENAFSTGRNRQTNSTSAEQDLRNLGTIRLLLPPPRIFKLFSPRRTRGKEDHKIVINNIGIYSLSLSPSIDRKEETKRGRERMIEIIVSAFARNDDEFTVNNLMVFQLLSATFDRYLRE